MKHIILLLFFLSPSIFADPGALCPKNHETKEVLGYKKIVFFASWCGSCVQSIRDADPETSLFVAIYDDHSKAEEALKFALQDRFSRKVKCFFDENELIGRNYGIKGLPYSVNLLEGH